MEPTCAEEQVMLQAIEAGVILQLLIVVGQPREEDTTPTLHCCGERCRPRMKLRAKEGRAVSRKTKILCVHSANPDVREEFTLESLFAAHDESFD
jgi:hypothetical protein